VRLPSASLSSARRIPPELQDRRPFPLQMTCELAKHPRAAGRLDFAHGAKFCNVAEIIDPVGPVRWMLNLRTICNSHETGSSECGYWC
jgi:hypothetical protein